MSQLYWRSIDPPPEEVTHPGPDSLEVNEQHALPVGLFFRANDHGEAEEVTSLRGLPVQLVPRQKQSLMLIPVSVSQTVVTLIAPANPARVSLMVTNETGTAVVRLMTTAGQDTPAPLTTTNGQYLHSAAGSNITVYGNNALWGLTVSVGAQTVSITEDVEI